jgi:hypothetical protein
VDSRTESTCDSSESGDPRSSCASSNVSNDEDALKTAEPKRFFFPHKVEVDRKHMTTVRLDNVPRSYSIVTLLDLLEKLNVRGFDFISLPIDPKTHTRQGFAVVNFISHSDAKYAMSVLTGFSVGHLGTQKPIRVSWNSALQGLAANLALSRLNREIEPEFTKPFLFKDGRLVHF